MTLTGGNKMKKINVLVVDDEVEIQEAIRIYLRSENINCLVASNGKEAIDVLKSEPTIALVLLDVMMPVMDGIVATSLIREFSNVPIIMLTAKVEDTDKIMGLSIGADDYVCKPFNPAELVARVKSQIRRYTMLGMSQTQTMLQENVIEIRGLLLNETTKQVSVDGEMIRLTPTELKILTLLMKYPNRVFSIDEIYERVWNERGYQAENTVAVHIRKIREKIEINPSDPRYLKVVWGIGYKIEA